MNATASDTGASDAELPAGLTEAALADAAVFVEASDHPVAGGRWHVLPDDTVWYERRPEVFDKAVTSASTLRTSPTWTSI